MTDETKKIFDAPWEASYDGEAEMLEVYDADHDRVCIIDDFADAKHAERLARLPELYEELKSASYDYCWSCLATLRKDPPTADELIENLCPRKPSCCGYNNRWKLLRKVRDGK